MLNKFNTNSKLIRFSQSIFIISVLLYLLESLFIRGLFSNIYLFMITLILSCISIIIALIKKAYRFVGLDAILTLICSITFVYLIYFFN